jgi:hypothetical protein
MEIKMKATSLLLFLMLPTICWGQADSLQRKLDAEDLENERYMHDSMLQQEMISTLNRLFGQGRVAQAMPDLNAMLVKRDSDLFQLTMLTSITTLHPSFINEWRAWAATLQSFAKTQKEPQFRHLELQALSFTLLSNAGDLVDQDAKALAKQPQEVRVEITKSCSADSDAFVDMIVPCWLWKTYSAIARTEIDNYARPTNLDAPPGSYRVDTLKIDMTGLTLRGGKWTGKDGQEVDIEKITAHTFYDVPTHGAKQN